MLASLANPPALRGRCSAAPVCAALWLSGTTLNRERAFVSLNQALRRDPCWLE
jgi:hypothetical protein